jgi:serine/threonine protein phosphatase PrpC
VIKLLQRVFGLSSTANKAVVQKPLAAEVNAETGLPTELPLYAARECVFPFAVWAVSDRGVSRPDNQDSIFHLQAMMNTADRGMPFGIFVVADGLGGHEDGQIASRLAARAVATHLIKTVYLPMLAGQSQDAASEPLNESLSRAVEVANRVVRENTDGGGSTLTALLLLDRTAYVAHIGDSRAYFVEKGALYQITEDHSLGQRLMELEGLSAEDIVNLPERHTLYKALGQATAPEPDIRYHHIAPGAHILLCSDGLWGFVTQQELNDAFQKNSAPREVCSYLTNLAISHGSDDNISMIVLMSQT